MYAKIIGTGSYVPKIKVTNSELEKYVDTTDEWIRDRTGIESRYIMDDESVSSMSAEASLAAIENAGINAEEIDMIIVSTVSPDYVAPNMACIVQSKIGAKNAFCIDINTACTGFLMAYNTAQAYINSGLAKTALVIGAEGLSKIVNWNDRNTCVLFADGAGAVILRADESAVFETVMAADGVQGPSLTCRTLYSLREPVLAGGSGKVDDLDESSYIDMDGREIFRFATREVPKCINQLFDKMGITEADIDTFVLHQANLRILEKISQRMKISMDKIPTNVQKYGNTSSACMAMLLDELNRTGRIKRGDKIIISGFGAGVTLGATYLIF